MKRAFMFITVIAVAALLLAGCAAPKASVPTPASSPAEAPSTERSQTTPGPVSSPEQTNGSPATTPAPTTQEPVTGPSTGTIQVLVTDAPKHDVSSVNLTVSKVEVHKVGGDGTSGNWTSLNVTHDKPFNLLNFNGLNMLLADGQVEAGKYTQLRMTIFEVIVSYDDVVGEKAEVPSGELKFVRPFTLPQGGTITLLVDIDAAKSVIVTGGNKPEKAKVLFKPVVKLQVISGSVVPEEEPDTEGPTVQEYNPDDNDTDVAVSDNLVLTFYDNMVKGTGNITIKKYSDDSIFDFEEIDVASANVTILGAAVTINPSFDFESGTSYFVLIDKGAFADDDGNSYAGISDKDTWNFTTGDNTPPTINSGTLASDNSYIDVAFSEGVYGDSAGPVEPTDFNLIFNQNGGNATGAAISSANNTSGGALAGGESNIRLNISITGIPSGVETIEVKPQDSSSIYDIDGNAAITETTTDTMTLNDQLAPTVKTCSPDDTNVAVSDNLVLTFNDNIVKGTGNITIKKYLGDSIFDFEEIDVASANVTILGAAVTINPSFDFESGTSYFVLIDEGAFADDDDNSYGGIADKETWNFTTASLP